MTYITNISDDGLVLTCSPEMPQAEELMSAGPFGVNSIVTIYRHVDPGIRYYQSSYFPYPSAETPTLVPNHPAMTVYLCDQWTATANDDYIKVLNPTNVPIGVQWLTTLLEGDHVVVAFGDLTASAVEAIDLGPLKQIWAMDIQNQTDEDVIVSDTTNDIGLVPANGSLAVDYRANDVQIARRVQLRHGGTAPTGGRVIVNIVGGDRVWS